MALAAASRAVPRSVCVLAATERGASYVPPRWFSDLSLLANHTAVTRQLLGVGGFRVSTTANLIQVRAA